MSGADNAPGRTNPVPDATLRELGEKLTKLREHLEQVVAGLNAANGHLRCHECGRVGPGEALGWTLRLCGDDALHAFCPDCDRRYFTRNGA